MTGLRFSISFCVTILLTVKGDVIVETNSGKVAGVKVNSIIKNEHYYSFMGIPFAVPPVGKLRYMPPKPHKGWKDVLNAKKETKPCAQLILSHRSKKRHGYSGTEDCLHLSIHTPKLPEEGAKNLPIIVFIYNENFKMSHNSSKEFGPDFFMTEDVILVTVNHRLGSLGFLSFEDDLLPGNNGIRDIILALYWLKSNIEHFAGDPNKITLMGSDGGGALVDLLLQSPKTKGLFHAAIIQDKTSLSPILFHGKPRERAIELSKQLELPATTSSFLIKQLADVSPANLTLKEEYVVHADEARAIQTGIIAFGPVVEHEHPDAVITKLPEDNEIDFDVPVMIGRSSREGIGLTARYIRQPQFLTYAEKDFLVILPLRAKFHFNILSRRYSEVVEEIKNRYFEEGYVRISGLGEYISYITDIIGFYPLDYTVRKYVNSSKYPIYYYTFDHSGDFNMMKQIALEEAATIDGTWGATLGDDLCYLFVCKQIKKAYEKAIKEDDSDDIKVLRNMVRMWSNFAKTGNPNSPSEDTWKPATKEDRDTLVISEEPTMKKRIHEDVVTYWDNFLKKYREKAVDGVITDLKDEL